MRSKKSLILAVLSLAVLALISATRVWVQFQLVPGAAATSDLTVTGQEGLPALMPIAVALLAVGVTLSIAGRVTRVVLGLLIVAFGGWITVTAVELLTDSQTALVSFGASVLHDVTGFAPSEHAALVETATSSVWPAIIVALGVLTVLSGLLVLLFGAKWQTGGRKYDAPSSTVQHEGESDRISEWDAQSEGEDPSDQGRTEYGSTDEPFTR